MTIYDIASEAGVSASTVSRVINKRPGINQATRQKVEKLLQKYNFQPNASAKGLVEQSSKIIGILMSDIRTVHHSESAYVLEQALQASGYSCLIANCGFSDESREKSFRMLASRRVEAVVLIGSTFQSETVKASIVKYFPHLPVIIENGMIDLPNVYSVIADEEQGIANCLELLYRKGRRNPYYINLNKTASNMLKISGFIQSWSAHNPNTTSSPPILYLEQHSGLDEWQISYEGTKELMQSHPEVDSLIFTTDFLANAGIRALMDLGIAIPEQVAVIGVDNSIYSKITPRAMTVLDNKMPELSINCANMLLQILANEPVSHKLMVLSEIIERQTT